MVAVWALAGLWSLACLRLAWQHPREVARAGGPRWRRELEAQLRDAHDDRSRVIAVNEALDEVERAFERHRRWPSVAGWLALAGTVLIMAGAATRGLEPALLSALPIAVVTWVGSRLATRRGAAQMGRRRAAVDAVIDELCADLVDVEVVLPRRRRAGRDRGRRRGRGR